MAGIQSQLLSSSAVVRHSLASPAPQFALAAAPTAKAAPAHQAASLSSSQGGSSLALRVFAVANTAMEQASQGSAGTTGSKRVLISLSDKTNLEMLAKGLAEAGYTILSTGGTAKSIEETGAPVTKVEDVTKFPEMLDGRVKTLHPAIHGGILARRDLPTHMEALGTHDIAPIDVVVVNLYPFVKTVTAAGGVAFEKGVENIDIGGPGMIRAAAKNHEHVWVVVDPTDYPLLLSALRGEGTPEEHRALRRQLAWKAFQHTSSYDSAVAEWLWTQQAQPAASSTNGNAAAAADTWQPAPSLTVPLVLSQTLRYGENPHQKAAFYLDSSLGEVEKGGIATAKQLHGKEMSYNNYLDADAAWGCVSEFSRPTCVVVKHTNPCGVASALTDDTGALLEAYRNAVRADPVSAFGGIVAFNVPVTEELAKDIREFRSPTDNETRMFYEIVVAPGYTEKGLEVLRGKSKTLRILDAKLNSTGRRSLRQVGGGWLLQESDDFNADDLDFKVVTKAQPTPEQLEDVRFAWRVVKHVKSNAITVAKNGKLLGMGSGQPNRVKSCEIALEKAAEEVKGSALASDAFFPFAWGDAVENACKAGVSIIAQPGGSVRDEDAIACCDKYGVAMVFTGIRHFRH